MTDLPYRVEGSEWEMRYLGGVIGKIRRRRDGFHAKLYEEHLGVYRTGDAAAEAIWRRYVEASTTRHEHAAVTHGGRGRHPHS